MSATPQPAPSRTTFSAANGYTAILRAGHVNPPAYAALPLLLGAWHLLSLDAPTVAALWVFFVARCAGVALPWTEPAAMFVAVWILYAADRLLDARNTDTQHGNRDQEQRHRFHHQHQRGFHAALGIACPLLVMLLLHANSAELRLDVFLGCLLLTWLLLIHVWPLVSTRPMRLPKELAVGVFFPAAIFIPAVSHAPATRPALLPDALLFAAVCSLNCLYIYAWEHPRDSGHAHPSTRWAIQRLPELTAATIIAAVWVAAPLCSTSAATPRVQTLLPLPALACAISATLLLLLHRNRTSLSPLTLRATADLCLLTPAVLLPVSHLARLI